jgi:hypothetical protein
MDTSGARRRLPFGRDAGAETLVALILVMAAPVLVVALLAGWRPPAPAELAAAHPWLAPLAGEPAAPQAVVARPAVPTDWPLPDGHFYARPAQASADGVVGYAVTDADGIGFWSEHQRLGGLAYLGYPLSRRFTADDAVLQVFQRGVLRYEPADGQVRVVRLLDQMHAAEHDGALTTRWGIPAVELPVVAEPPPDLVAERLAWVLRDHPALAAYVAAAPDAAALLGLATSTVQDVGPYYVVRFQAGALQEWKEDVPWARAGEVTPANVGAMAAELGLFPADALAPAAGTPPAGSGG